MPDLDHALWWHVYPLGACGAPIRGEQADRDAASGPHPRLAQLLPWLDHAVELGCSGVLLGPIFASRSHGYDTLDHLRIDPRLGDDATFDEFVAAAHERGLRVLLDGVFNHVSIEHPLVAAGSPVIARRDGALVPWEGHGELVTLDHAHPDTIDLVASVMEHWLERGIAGWRLDVAYAVPPEFWQAVLDRVRRHFPDVLTLGEVIHGDYARLAHAGTLDSVTQYELWKGVRGSIADRNLWELAHAIERHDQFSRHLVTQTFVSNHDVTRIASALGEAGALVATAVVLTLPGMPSIYAGDEWGERGEKGSGEAADDALRPELPGSPADITDRPGERGEPVYRAHQRMIGFRRRHAWLARARVEVIAKDNTWLEYRCTGDGHRLDVRVDLEPTPRIRATADDGEVLVVGG